jgi:hypothetical protein
MRHPYLSILAFLASFLSALAARSQTGCAAFVDTIEYYDKLAAMEEAADVGDTSVYRAQLRELRIANDLRRIDLNLTLMARHNCVLPKEPFAPADYALDASTCELAKTLRREVALACDLNRWRRSATAPLVSIVPEQTPSHSHHRYGTEPVASTCRHNLPSPCACRGMAGVH